MKIDHVAIWTENLEELKDFYSRFFNGIPGEKYINKQNNFQSYFISFNSGSRLELMTMPNIPNNLNNSTKQSKGIIHLAFGLDSVNEVDLKAKEFELNGFQMISGPKITGDGYYEFEIFDPDKNRIEITTKVEEKRD